jgi:hypothetical protein
MSTKSGRAPAWDMASVVAINVFGTVTTMSPERIPAAISVNRKGIRAAVDTHTESRFAKLSKVLFKSLHQRTTDKSSGTERCFEDVDKLISQPLVDRDQIKEGNLLITHVCLPI